MSVTESSPSFAPPPPPEFTQTARAFEEQFDYVYRAMRRFGVGEPDIEDLVQEVFLVMWRRWAEYEPHRPLRPWLAGIAFHIAQKHLSRGRREVPRGEVDREDESPHPDERLASARSRDIALQALSGLPAKQRVLLVMHDLDGVEMRQIAATLQVPLFTAYSRLRRARLGFTRLVEELQKKAPLLAVSGTLTVRAVMEGERQEVPAPPESRRRARRQLRAWMAAPAAAPRAGKGGPPAPGASGGWSLPAPGLVMAAAVVVAATGLLVARWSWGGRVSRAVAATAAPGVQGAPLAGRTGHPDRREARPVLASVVPPTRLQPGVRGQRAAGMDSLGSGLNGYWRFDDGYGSTSARDLSSAGRDCWLHRLDPNGAWVTGALSGAIALDRGFVECPQGAHTIRSTTPMSVSAWVRIDAWGPQHVAVVSRPIARDTAKLDYFNLGMLDGKLKVRSDFWNVRVTARSKLPLGRWVHVAFTYDAQATLRLFMDGQEMGARTSKRRKRQGLLTGPVFIGAGVDAADRPASRQQLSGTVDEVAIYGRTLAPDEIAALAAGGQPPLSQ